MTGSRTEEQEMHPDIMKAIIAEHVRDLSTEVREARGFLKRSAR